MIGFLPFVAVVVISRGNPENKVARIFWRSSDLKQWIHYPSNTTALQVNIFTLMMTYAQALFVGRTGSSYVYCQIYWWVEGAEMKFCYYSIQKELCKEATYQSIETDVIMKRTEFFWDEGKLEGWPWPFLSELTLVYALYSELSVVSCALTLLREATQSHSHHNWHVRCDTFQFPSLDWTLNPVKMKKTVLLWNRCFKTSNALLQELGFSENCFRIWELQLAGLSLAIHTWL